MSIINSILRLLSGAVSTFSRLVLRIFSGVLSLFSSAGGTVFGFTCKSTSRAGDTVGSFVSSVFSLVRWHVCGFRGVFGSFFGTARGVLDVVVSGRDGRTSFLTGLVAALTDFADWSIGLFVVSFIRRVVILQVDTLIFHGVFSALFGVLGGFLSFRWRFWRLLCGILGLLSSLASLRPWWELGGFVISRFGC